MKKITLIFILTILGVINLYADELDPGFGDEGGGDAQEAPAATVDVVLIPLFITGIVVYLLTHKNK